PEPVVQRVFRPADSARRSGRESPRDLERFRVELGILDTERDEADALGVFPAQGFAEQQMVFGLGKPAEQRPDDRRMVTRRDAEPRMPVDDAGRSRRDRYIGEE